MKKKKFKYEVDTEITGCRTKNSQSKGLIMYRIDFKVSLLLIVLLSLSSNAVSFKLDIHSMIMLDTYFFSGTNSNDGSYNNANRVQVRKAALEVEGIVGEKINYNLEIGLSTCTGSTGNNLKLMEAGLMYMITDDLSFGVQQGHILYGFAGMTGCGSRLALEKPEFVNTFGVCHPLGFVVNNYSELGDNMGAEFELSILNGQGDTMDGEYQYNAGVLFETPLKGLSITSAYNYNVRQYYDENFQKFSKAGWRMIGGMEYLNNNLWLTTEYYKGKGFTEFDQTMDAWYAQAGYDISLNTSSANSIQPYCRYEYWNRDSGKSKKDIIEFYEVGVNLKLTMFTQLRASHRVIESSSKSDNHRPNTTTIRLQTNF